MKFKKVIGFGDSWMWGDELLDPALREHPQAHPVLVENTQYRESHCFLGQVAQHFGIAWCNLGWPGGSLQSAIWNYLWWLENTDVPPDQCLILVANTDCNRTSFYNHQHRAWANDPDWNRYVHSAWIHSGNDTAGADWTELVKKHMVLAEGHRWSQLNYMQSVLFFDGQHHANAGRLWQFNVAAPPVVMRVKSLLWPDTVLPDLMFEHHARQDLLCPQNHPNELGHQIIADLLIKQIESAIM